MPFDSSKSVFPNAVKTSEKINVTSLTIALAELSKDKAITGMATKMVNSLYAKTQVKALKRASAVLAVLRSHE